ncbi:MAG: PIG-L family deacetylase [bacterium]|nr:PIG-L family deacetylase [bacterium]
MNILAIGAHPDDLEISGAGTLAKYRQKDYNIYMVCVTDGRYGRTCEPKKMIEIRKTEAFESAAVIDAELRWMGYSDLGIEENLALRNEIVEIIREIKPEVIITHDPSSFNPDHKMVSKTVSESLIPCITTTLESKYSACEKMPILYFMSTVCGTGFFPEQYVDISDTLETKLEMLSKHKSQLEVYTKYESRDLLKFVEAKAFTLGFSCGIKYAEGFRKLHTWGQNISRRVLP